MGTTGSTGGGTVGTHGHHRRRGPNHGDGTGEPETGGDTP